MSTYETEQLVELVSQKHDCLTRLQDLGRKQVELVGAGELKGLLELLAAKQKQIDRLGQIEKGLDPFRGQRPDERRWPSEEDRRRCAALIDECDQLLAEVVQCEQTSESQMRQSRDRTAAVLHSAHTAQRARGAYTAQPRPPANRLDLSSEG